MPRWDEGKGSVVFHVIGGEGLRSTQIDLGVLKMFEFRKYLSNF